MALGIYPIFNPPQPDITFDSDGALMLRYYEALDRIAHQAGVAPLRAFGDNREVPEDFAGPPEALEDILGPYDTWHSSAAGLRSIEAIIEAMTTNTPQVAELAPDEVVEELQALAHCLRQAHDRQVCFRLVVG